MTRKDDVLPFLDSVRKPESVDPMHKWIGTYNTYRIQLMRFFKWLYSPDIEQKKRPKPPIIENVPQLKRKEKSIYKPTDLGLQKTIRYFWNTVLIPETDVIMQCQEIQQQGHTSFWN